MTLAICIGIVVLLSLLGWWNFLGPNGQRGRAKMHGEVPPPKPTTLRGWITGKDK
jgi:hypothetical protein